MILTAIRCQKRRLLDVKIYHFCPLGLCLYTEDTSKVLFWFRVYCSLSLTLDSMSLLSQMFVPELWYDLSTSAPKGKTEYTIKTRCLIFLMSCSVTRFYSTTNTNSSWPAAWNLSDNTWMDDSVEFSND